MLAQEAAWRRLCQFNHVIRVTQPADAAQSLRIGAVDTGEVNDSNYQIFFESDFTTTRRGIPSASSSMNK